MTCRHGSHVESQSHVSVFHVLPSGVEDDVWRSCILLLPLIEQIYSNKYLNQELSVESNNQTIFQYSSKEKLLKDFRKDFQLWNELCLPSGFNLDSKCCHQRQNKAQWHPCTGLLRWNEDRHLVGYSNNKWIKSFWNGAPGRIKEIGIDHLHRRPTSKMKIIGSG